MPERARGLQLTPEMLRAAIFDIDGTLVDTNELHVRAWREVFLRYGKDVPAAAIWRQMGKGGDQLIPVFWSPDEVARFGDEMQERRVRIFVDKHLPYSRPFPGARQLFQRLRHDGLRIALASSAREEELCHHLQTLGVRELVDAVTSADDAERSKPHPDIVQAALGRLRGVDASQAILVGDSPFDGQAGARAGMKFIGVLSGGFQERDLRRAGAIAVYRDIAALEERYDDSPLVQERAWT